MREQISIYPMKISVLLLLILIISCTSDDSTVPETVEVVPKNTAQLNFDDNPVDSEIVSVNAVYICEERISLNIMSKEDSVTSALFNLELLKTGEIIFAKYYHPENFTTKEYKSADFIPGSTLNIENFNFIENEKLSFTLSGHLLQRSEGFLDQSETKSFSVTFDIEEFSKSTCNVFQDFVQLNNEDFTFYNLVRSSQGYNLGREVNYHSLSLEGYYFNLGTFNETISNLPLGTYNFDENSNTKISLSQYIGAPRFYSADPNLFAPDWKDYDCAGSFTILSVEQIDQQKVTTISMNFTASFNGVIEYNFNNALIKTVW